MLVLLSMFIVGQWGDFGGNAEWTLPDSTDILIEDTLGAFVSFGCDYNYTTGDMYVICLVDSGYYFGSEQGRVVFQSTNHGLTWENIDATQYNSSAEFKNIGLVATRGDSFYTVGHMYYTGADRLYIRKNWWNGSDWQHTLLSTFSTSNEFHSPVLVRDDFDPNYLYLGYIIHCASPDDDSIRLVRSTDGGNTWPDTVYRSYIDQYDDCDLTISDSTVYFTYLYSWPDYRRARTRTYRNRGMSSLSSVNIKTTSDTLYWDIRNVTIGATTTVPDNGQLVYTYFIQEDSVAGGFNLLYKYSTDGGANWTSTIDTMLQGLTASYPCDIRGYQAAPNEYINIVYMNAPLGGMVGQNVWKWSSESDPTNWHTADTVSPWLLFGMYSELIYSPGAAASGSGVIYNDVNGNLWFDAPWIISGIPEIEGNEEFTISSNIVHSSDQIRLSHAGVDIYDLTGRKIQTVNKRIWDLKNASGEKVGSGIYFIVSKKTGDRKKVIVVK